MRGSDSRQLLGFVAEAQALQHTEPFTTALLDRLAELMRCDFVTYYEFDLVTRRQSGYVACAHEAGYRAAPPEPSWEPPPTTRTGVDNRPVQTWSDRYDRGSRRRFETTSWARDFEVVDSAWTLFPSDDPKRSAAVVLHAHDRDFAERQREALLLLRPHIFALIRDSRARRRLRDLSAATEGAEDGPRGFLLLDNDFQIEHASPAARRILGTWFGPVGQRLPAALDDWRRSDAVPRRLTIDGVGKRLVLEVPTEGALVLTEEEAPPPLTPRELDVLRCIAAGHSTAETARLLWVTPATVSKHLEHIYRKLGVTSRTAAVAAVGRCL